LSILITGGAGYIGSHALIELDKLGYDFIVFDNLSNSSKESIKRVEKIINKSISFEEGDVRDKKALEEVFKKYDIDSVIHLAGLKAVGESVCEPLKYYDNNVAGTLVLLAVMKKFDCKKIVFSSSATVYGNPNSNPIKEDFSVGNTINPYGRTKYFIEEILKDLYSSDNSFQIVILRYFNPVGAHESGTIGEDPNGIPNNLMPFISQVAVGKREFLSIFGGDYDTADGTGVRDYIHVVDLAYGHVKAIDYLNKKTRMVPLIVNLGTGIGYSVLDMVRAFEKASGKSIPYKIVERREGDISTCYSNPSYAKVIFGWEAKKTIEDMCIDSWKWQSNNLDGYKGVK
jgi:UDP-glucose 4-epimerase